MNLSWQDRAACLNITSVQRDRYFFPGTSGRPAPESAYDYARETWCKRCPVVDECLAFALEHEDKWGLFGGMSPEQRRELVKGPIDHGSLNGYRQHYDCNGFPCDVCRAHRRDYDAAKKAS